MTRLGSFFGRDADHVARDGRILPVTRWLGRILVPVLTVAFLILFGVPDRTTELFAWTISPRMTPILMGAGYGTGAYFFYRVATIENWHEVALVFPGIVVFTWFMAAATGLHWENFNHDHVTFVIWTFLYAVAPLLVPAVWYLNRRTEPRESAKNSPRESVESVAHLPSAVRWVSALSGLAIVVTAFVLFVVPDVLVTHWPWDASPLTARIMLGWFALFGVVNLGVWFDSRWSTARIPVQTQVLGFGILLLGAIRVWSDFDAANPLLWAFFVGVVLYLGAIVALYYVMETR